MKHWILAAATLFLIQGIDAGVRPAPPCSKPCKAECPKPEPCCPPVCFERGHPMDPCCAPAAYNVPAATELRCGYDTFLSVSFLYWEAIQGGMDLGIPYTATIVDGAIVDDFVVHSAVGASIPSQNTQYKPGFQLGIGWTGAQDNWVLYAEYTWLHGSTHTTANAPEAGVTSIDGRDLPQNGIWNPSSWLAGSYFTNDFTPSISSRWTYKIDLLDAQISRPFYSGTRFTVEPFFGLRGAWIRQQMHLEAVTVSDGEPIRGPIQQAHYFSRSAAVGPRLGVNGNWHLGYGIRFIGDAATSLLFTSYDVKQNVASPDLPDFPTSRFFPLKTKIDDLNVLRPNLELSLGLGWGSYFSCRRFHWDLAATYDFNMFWEQNMMRYLADLTADDDSWPSGAAGDLYLQGLTIRTQFDF